MEKKDLLQPENENLKIAFVFGAVLYDELTEERTKPISKELAETGCFKTESETMELRERLLESGRKPNTHDHHHK